MHISKAADLDRVLDLTACDREPIHLSEAIQPHGLLIGVSPADLRVSMISENASLHGRLAAGDMLGRPLSQLIDRRSLDQVFSAQLKPGQSLALGRIGMFDAPDLAWRGTVHAQEDLLLLEADRIETGAEHGLPEQFEQFHAGMVRLQRAVDFTATGDSLVAEVRLLTGFARVMLYRFAADWTGEVIAEDRDETVPSFLGLHFPASDIPVPARALYTTHFVRQIPDVEYQPVKLLHGRGTPIDLSQIGLRSVFPCHLAYLRNMGVGASMSVSLLRNGRLWGMVACHHPTRHAVAAEPIRFCSLLADWAMARFALIEEAELARGDVGVKTLEARLVQQAAAREDKSVGLLQAGLLEDNRDALLDLLGASGLVLSVGGNCMTLGEVPGGAEVQNLLGWLAKRGSERLATDHLASVVPAPEKMGNAAGMLAVPLGEGGDDFIIWFRPEIARTVTWAGNPATPAEDDEGQTRLAPRHSFAAWTEQVRGRSHPWSTADVAAANSLRDALMGIVARRATLLQRSNQQLLRSNEELESFAYVASHDLKEPLRQIEMFGTLLQRAFGREGDAPDKIEKWFSGITSSTQRLRSLIDHLAEYSRLGSESRPFEPTDIGALLAEVVQDFSGQIAASGAVIESGKLPTISCDAIQIRQVLQNLISNALKYRDPARPLAVRISAQPIFAQGTTPREFEFRVEDNGIGFDERHQVQIFKPFERLHSGEKYEGTGLGLAICRKVIDRHGGTLCATSRPGEGSVFIFTVPRDLASTKGFETA